MASPSAALRRPCRYPGPRIEAQVPLVPSPACGFTKEGRRTGYDACMRALSSLPCAIGLAVLVSCSPDPGSPTPATQPWLSDARVLVQGVGSDNQDCRTGVCQHNENTDLTT